MLDFLIMGLRDIRNSPDVLPVKLGRSPANVVFIWTMGTSAAVFSTRDTLDDTSVTVTLLRRELSPVTCEFGITRWLFEPVDELVNVRADRLQCRNVLFLQSLTYVFGKRGWVRWNYNIRLSGRTHGSNFSVLFRRRSVCSLGVLPNPRKSPVHSTELIRTSWLVSNSQTQPSNLPSRLRT